MQDFFASFPTARVILSVGPRRSRAALADSSSGRDAQADLGQLRASDALVRTRTLPINHVQGTVKAMGYRFPRQLGHADVQMVAKVYGRFVPGHHDRDHWEMIAAARDTEIYSRGGAKVVPRKESCPCGMP